MPITLFRSITMSCGTDIILWNIPIVGLNVGPHNNVSPTD